MQVLSDSVALGLPQCRHDIEAGVIGLDELKAGQREAEIRIGIGPLTAPVPARLIGYAACLADALRKDVAKLTASASLRIAIFSSAPKAMRNNWSTCKRDEAFTAIVTLGGALRICGVSHPIQLEFSNPDWEISEELAGDIGPDLRARIEERAQRHGAGKCLRYALDHAAESMFGDLCEVHNAPFRITLGGATEALYWAVRMRIRSTALALGRDLAPVAGIFVRAAKVPWYYPTSMEPSLSEVCVPGFARAIKHATLPGKGGNTGLKREIEMTLRQVQNPNLLILQSALTAMSSTRLYAHKSNLKLGPRLQSALDGEAQCHEKLWFRSDRAPPKTGMV